MARRGRKRKPGVREPGTGDIRRPSAKERERLAREKNLMECYVVSCQPHRRGFRDPLDKRAESPFGHFCARHRLASEIYDAGIEYEALAGRWGAILGVPKISAIVQEHGKGAEPSDSVAKECRRRVNEIRRDLQLLELRLVNGLIFDRIEIPQNLIGTTIAGLAKLAKCFGKDLGSHPFQSDNRGNAGVVA